MNEHHFNKFFQLNHPICLNTDDTCVFDSQNSQELEKIVNAFDLNV